MENKQKDEAIIFAKSKMFFVRKKPKGVFKVNLSWSLGYLGLRSIS
jgi:hypothetical protein